ncbi:MAG TPA: TRAP transporter substrate-binding protein DctP [Anaeromyxobacteraceae bacterium]|nr:TRAP transporter substrate-binding protein DctP [Anaeromyxobacteraceae bacterium]
MRPLALAAVLLAVAPLARAQEVTIKLGTLAPNGSTWHSLLLEMGERWAEASQGRVKLRIYPGGTQGSEGDMVRKMKVGQLQGVAISNIGMADISRDPEALSVPGLIGSEAEMRAVFNRLEPELDRTLEAKDVVPIQWSQIGFVRIFCAKAYRTPAQMTDAKMFAWDGDPASVDAWAAAGFKPVVVSSTDVMTSLETGMLTCIANVPLYMLTTRLFERASHMVDVPWGYLVGATLVSKSVWQKIPADLRPKLLDIAHDIGNRVDSEVRKLNDDAVSAMRKQGLEVVEVDPAPWRATAEKAWPTIRGKVVSAQVFDEVLKLRDEYRAGGGR